MGWPIITAPAVISLSYRREDSVAIAGRLYDRLQSAFGRQNVFMDFDSIPAGVDFRDHISQTIEHSRVVIALIGPNWLGDTSVSRRIDDPADFVRLEIALALARGIPVIPVLINQTEMPKPDLLPDDLRALAFRNALPLDSGRDFHSHAERLVGAVRAIAPGPGRFRKGWPRPLKRWAWAVAALLVLLLLVVGGGLLVLFLLPSPQTPKREVAVSRDAAAITPTPAPVSRITGTVPHTAPANPTPSASGTAQSSPPRPPSKTKDWTLRDFSGSWSHEKSNPLGGGGSIASHDRLSIKGDDITETITTEWTAQNKCVFRMTLRVRFSGLQLFGNQLNARCVSAEVTDLFDPNQFGKMANISEQTQQAAKKGVGLTYAWTLTDAELRRGDAAWTKD